MTVTLQFDDPVDEFLAHHGVLGMHWGNRKGPQAGVTVARQPRAAAAPKQSWGQRRVARGNAIIARSNGSTKRALGVIAGKTLASHIIMVGGGMALNQIPNQHLQKGAKAALGFAGTAYQMKQLNNAIKVGQAHHANKVAAQTK